MAQFLFGKQLTASLSALARLGVADHMGDTAISADELAGKVGAHAPSLFRVMRMLAGFGVFSQEPGGKFALTPLGALLRTDVSGSMRYMGNDDRRRAVDARLIWPTASAPARTASPWPTASRSSICLPSAQ
ncbi:MAG: hypothetical protein WBB72_13830, partial [Methyloceanibacter sp.]